MDEERKIYLHNIGKSLVDGVLDVSVRDTRVVDGQPHINKIVILNAPRFEDYVEIANSAEVRLQDIWYSTNDGPDKSLRNLAEALLNVPIISGNYEGSDNGTYYLNLRNSALPYFGFNGEVIPRKL